MLTNPWGWRLRWIASAFTGVVAGPTVGWLRRRKRKSAEPWFRAENTVRHQKLSESLTPLQCRKVAAWPRRSWSGVQGIPVRGKRWSVRREELRVWSRRREVGNRSRRRKAAAE